MNKLLWFVQILCALLFLFAGGSKLVMPAEQLTAQSTMSESFLRFIAVVEVLGALGLVLPWALRIKPILTPLAAIGLTIIMVGAVVTTLTTPELPPATAAIPFVTGLLTALVAWGRLRTSPRPAERERKAA